jgi:flagellar protein FlaJ
MYALAHGGLDPVEVVRRTARREDTYGEQAREMGMVVNDMDYLGTDFVTALHNAADLTPCAATSDFLADMVGVLESGGDFEAFLEDRRQQHVESLTGEQESYLEQIGLFAEAYVTVLVAGPLFLIILLLVIGLMGGSTITQVYVIIYAGVPLLSMGILVLLDTIAAPFTQSNWRMDVGSAARQPPDAGGKFAKYERRKRRKRLLARLRDPLQALRNRPALSFLLTLPVALVLVAVLHTSGVVTVSTVSVPFSNV